LMTDDPDDRVLWVLYAGAMVRRWRELLGEESQRYPDAPLLAQGWDAPALLAVAFDEAQLAARLMREGHTKNAADSLRYVEAALRVAWKKQSPPTWDGVCDACPVASGADYPVEVVAALGDMLMFSRLPVEQLREHVVHAGSLVRAWRGSLPVRVDDGDLVSMCDGRKLLFRAVLAVAAAHNASNDEVRSRWLRDAEISLREWWEGTA